MKATILILSIILLSSCTSSIPSASKSDTKSTTDTLTQRTDTLSGNITSVDWDEAINDSVSITPL